MSGLHSKKYVSMQDLTDTTFSNVQNDQSPVYENGTFVNKTVLLPSSLPSGSDGDVIVSDGAGGIVSRNALSVNNNGHLSGFVANINGSDIKLGSSAGSLSGTDNISIGFGAGNGSGNNAVSIGTSAGTFGGDNSVSIGRNAKADDDNCIVINATGSLLDSGITSSCYIAPLRDIDATTALDPYVIQYDDLTKEMFKSVNLHTQHIECVNINNTGTLTNVGTASLWNGQLTVGGGKVVAGAGNNNLVVDLTNQKVAINKATPDEQLDINGTLRIEADTTQTIRFYDTQGGGSPDEDGRIEVTQDSGGGQMKFYTLQTGGGTPNERLTINRYGALGLSGSTGSAGQILSSNGSSSAPTWTNDIDQARTTTFLNINSPLQLGGSYGSGTAGQAVVAGNGSLTHPSFINIYDLLYPIGSVKIMYVVWSGFPGQTWVEFGQGRTLVGLDSADSQFDTIGETGGTKTHTLEIDEIPSHTHDQKQTQSRIIPSVGMLVGSFADGDFNNVRTNGPTGATGGGLPHNNLQPYIVVRYYRRTA